MAMTEYLHTVNIYCPEGAAEYTDAVEAHEIESHLAAGGGGRRFYEAGVLKAFRAADAGDGIPSALAAHGMRWTLARDFWSRANNASCYEYGTDGSVA
jgi:hypothetical protein